MVGGVRCPTDLSARTSDSADRQDARRLRENRRVRILTRAEGALVALSRIATGGTSESDEPS